MHKIVIGLIIDMNVWQESRKQFKRFLQHIEFKKKWLEINLNGSFKVRRIFQKDFTIIESSCKRKRNKTSHTNITLNLFLSNLICVKFKHLILTRVFTYPLLLTNIRTWNAVQIRIKMNINN